MKCCQHCPDCREHGIQATNLYLAQTIKDLSRRQQHLEELLLSLLRETENTPLAANNLASAFSISRTEVVDGDFVLKTHPNNFPECCLVGQFRFGLPSWGASSGSGVLIHPQLVLTAAHIPQPRVVALDVQDKDEITPDKIIHVKKRIPSDLGHDLALLILEREVEETITPARLATAQQTNAAKEARIVGFGASDIFGNDSVKAKRKGAITITHIVREELLPSSELAATGRLLGFDPSFEFVASGPNNNCEGDSGGPLYISPEDKGVVGITRGYILGTGPKCGKAGVFARADKHLEWIRKEAGKHPDVKNLDKFIPPPEA